MLHTTPRCTRQKGQKEVLQKIQGRQAMREMPGEEEELSSKA